MSTRGDTQAQSVPLGWRSCCEIDDYYFTQLLGSAQDSASDVAECLRTAAKIIPGDVESWHREWKTTAEISKERGDRAFAFGNTITARANWLRASNYFRTSERFLDLADQRRTAVLSEMRESSIRFLEHLSPPGETIRTPNLNGVMMEGYFLRASGTTSPLPVVICVGGLDHFKDEYLYGVRRHGHERSLSLLLIDLLELGAFKRQKLLGRHDESMSIRSWVDYLVSRSDVDETRIVIFGDGQSASLATQAAAHDDRFRAAVCDGGMSDLLHRAVSFQRFIGDDDLAGIRFSFEKVKHSCIARSIACPTLVTVVERGGFGAISAGDLYKSAKAVNSNLSLRVFSHLQALTLDAQSPNPTLVNEFVFDWIVDRLRE
jgi:hypothetical protein